MPGKKTFTISIIVSIAAHFFVIGVAILWRFGAITGGEKIMSVTLEQGIIKKTDQSMPPLKAEPDRPDSIEERPKAPDERIREDTIELGSPESENSPYLVKIRNEINKYWSYPQESLDKGEEGTVQVTFSIDSEGILTSSKISNSSGWKNLDDEALVVIKRASPFPHFPAGLKLERLNINARFNYRIAY